MSLPAAAAVVVAADKQLPVKRKTVSKHPILQQKRSSIQNRQSTEDDIPVPLSSNPMDLLEEKFGSMIVTMNPTLKDKFTKTLQQFPSAASFFYSSMMNDPMSASFSASASASLTMATAEPAAATTNTTSTTTMTPATPPLPVIPTPFSTPPVIVLSRKTRPKIEDRIEYNPKSFLIQKGRTEERSVHASICAKGRSVKEIIKAILNPKLTDEQVVTTIRTVSSDRRCRRYFKSAGLIDVEELEALRQNQKQMYRVLSKVMKTENMRGRPNDDIRSFVRSIFLAIRDSPIKDGEQKRKGTIQSRICNFGIPRRTAFLMV